MAEELIRIQKVSIKRGLLRIFTIEAHIHSLPVYLAICAYSKDNKTSQVGISTLITKTGLSRNTIFRCIDGLENVKFIKRMQTKKGRIQVYLLLGAE